MPTDYEQAELLGVLDVLFPGKVFDAITVVGVAYAQPDRYPLRQQLLDAMAFFHPEDKIGLKDRVAAWMKAVAEEKQQFFGVGLKFAPPLGYRVTATPQT